MANATAAPTTPTANTARPPPAWRCIRPGVPNRGCGDSEGFMRFLFLMDPMETVLTAKDTTFAMMLASASRGHECHHALPLNLEVLAGDVYAPAARVHVSRKSRPDGFFDDDWK